MGEKGWSHIEPGASVAGKIVGASWNASNTPPADGDWSLYIAPDNPDAYRNHAQVLNPGAHKTFIHIGPIGSGDPPAWQRASGLVECEVQPANNDRKWFDATFGAACTPYRNGSARRGTVFGFRAEDVSHADKVEIHSVQFVVTEPDPDSGEAYVFVYSDSSHKGSFKPQWPPGAHNVVTADVQFPLGRFRTVSEKIIRPAEGLRRHDYAVAAHGADRVVAGTVTVGSNGFYEAALRLVM